MFQTFLVTPTNEQPPTKFWYVHSLPVQLVIILRNNNDENWTSWKLEQSYMVVNIKYTYRLKTKHNVDSLKSNTNGRHDS